MSHWHKWGCNIKLLWIRPWQNHCFETDPGHSQRSAAKWDCTKLPTTFLTLISVWVSTLRRSLTIPLHLVALEGFVPVGDVRWGFSFLVVSQRTIVEDWMWRNADILRSQTFPLRVTMHCLFFLLCYIHCSLHVNVLSGCLFNEPIIYTESIFAFKLNIFRKQCSFWRFTQVRLVLWRKLTMKSHSASSDGIGIILC